MRALIHEFALAVSRLIRAPGFSVLIVAVLAVGLGGTIFMFGAIKGYILSPLPFPESHELMHVENQNLEQEQESLEVRALDFLDYREQQQAFEDLAGLYVGTVNLSGSGADRPERYDGAFITDNAFSLLGVTPHLGRLLQPDDARPGGGSVVLIGYSVWQNRYAGDPDIIGRMVRVNGRDTAVVGVMPPEFAFPINQKVWLPVTIDPATIEARDQGITLEVFGRLNDGVSLEQATAELNTIAANLADAYPKTNAGRTVLVQPFAHEFVDFGARTTIYTMTAAVVLLLVMGCANAANLVLVRATRSQRELAIRSAMGASRRQLVMRVLAECLVLSTLAALIGWGVADIAGDAMMNALSAGDAQIPYWVDISPDGRVLAFTVLTTIATTLLAGLLPALRGTHLNLVGSLKEGARSTGNARMGRSLVVVEIALSCVLLVCAGLLIRSTINLDQRDLGVDSGDILLSRMGLFEDAYPTTASRGRFFSALVENLSQVSGVDHAFAATGLPGTQTTYWTKIAVEGDGLPEDQFNRTPWFNWTVATPEIFDALAIAVIDGRPFDARDDTDSEPVVVVTRNLAEDKWPRVQAVGRQIALGASSDPERYRRVIGVVDEVHLGDSEDPMRGGVFVPMEQETARFAYAGIRTAGDPLAFADAMRRTVQSLDPDLPIYWVQTYDYWIRFASWTERVIAVNFEIFGAIALILAAVGMYGVLAYSVAQRTREIGVRRALGADNSRIIKQMARQIVGQLGLGMAIGLVLAFGFSQALDNLLIGIEPTDPITYSSVVGVLFVVAVVAALVPTLRALRVDPMIGLRQE